MKKLLIINSNKSKRMKKLMIVFISLFFAFSINAQEGPKEIFKIKYAALVSEFTPNGSKEVTSDNIEQFREQYKRLQTGLEEIEMAKFEVATEDNLTIFEMKEFKSLKKEGQIEDLENILKKYSEDMKLFLGENNKFGLSEQECLMTYSNLKQSIKRKDYKTACNYWREMYKYYPKYKGAYSKGDFLMRTEIKMVHKAAFEAYENAKKAQEENNAEEANKFTEQQKQLLAEKELWIDSLLMIYDQRMKYLGDDKNYGTGYLKGKKGSYIYEYRKDSALNQAYDLLKESIEIQKENSLYTVVKDYFDASMDMVKAKKIGPEQMVTDYNTTTDILKKSTEKFTEYVEKEKKKSKPKEDKIENWERMITNNTKVSEYITKYFASSEYSECEYLIPAFKEHFDEHKSEEEWLKTVTGILSWKECTDDPFYGEAAEALYNIEPSADAAFKLALFYLKKEKYSDAAKYFEEAYTQEEDGEKKGEYYYYAAVVSFAQNKFSNARSLALKAAGSKENYGKPYVLIAKLYAASAGSCGSDNFEKSAVYWAAVDKLIKAKSIDPSVEAEANKLINKYSSRYPNSEEGFMRGIYKGNAYKINCWIQENTSARY